jgi:DNA-binding beta-propeller fold protein YncE
MSFSVRFLSWLLAGSLSSAFAQTGTVAIDSVSLAYGVALDSAERYIYISCQGSGQTVRGDLLTGQRQTFSTQLGAYGICFSKDYSKLYIGSGDRNNTALATLTVPGLATDTLCTGLGAPSGFALNNAGTFLYAADRRNDRIVKINTATGDKSVFFTAAYLNDPYACALTPDGQYLYVSNTLGLGGSILKIATADSQLVDSLTVAAAPLIGNPLSITIDPTGTHAYIINGGSGSINKMVLATKAVTEFRAATTLPSIGQAYNCCMDRAGNNLYCPNLMGTQIIKVTLSGSGVIDRPGRLAAAMELNHVRTDLIGPAVHFNCTLPAPGRVALDIYNMHGEQVRSLAHDYTTAGRHTLTWNTQGIVAGMYLCRISTGSGSRVVRVAVVH